MKFLTNKAITEINSSLDKKEVFPIFSENRVDLDDLKDQFMQIKKLGPLKSILTKLPGILQLLGKQKSIGSYFYGRISNNLVFVSTSLSDYEIQKRRYTNPVISAKNDNLNELKLMTEKSDAIKSPYNAVVDFRVYMHDNAVENATEYMDSDLYSYAYQQLYMQPCTGNSIIYFGMISVKENGSYKLRCVFYDFLDRTFIKVSNLYYMCAKEIHKFNNDSAHKSIELTSVEKQDILRKLKSYVESGR